MAKDINEELSTIYDQAKRAINDDLKQNFYNAAQARTQAFRQLNNNANARHALYSGVPAATQMQYDQSTFLPGTATMVTNAIAKQQNNQEQWDKYMDYISKLNEQANYYRDLASKTNADASGLQQKMNAAGATNAAGGMATKPNSTSPAGTSAKSVAQNMGNTALNQFSGGGGW